MDKLAKREPTSLETAKSLRQELAQATTVQQSVVVRERAKIFTDLFRKRRKTLGEVIPLIEVRLSAERQIGQKLKQEGDRRGAPLKLPEGTSMQAALAGGSENPLPPGLSAKAAHVYRTIALVPDAEWSDWMAAARGQLEKLDKEEQARVIRDLTTQSVFARARREYLRVEKQRELEEVSHRVAPFISGGYDVLVIDPPWPMQKIERDERPNQVMFDYPTMDEPALAALELPEESGDLRPLHDVAAPNAHVWLWTTHKFLPMAFRLLDAWKLKYVCTFVWHKPGGFQPIGLPQYNCEFALYARKGSPEFVNTKALFTCFNAERTFHSEKPDAFFSDVARITAGRRLEVFARRVRDGFDGWGNEAQ